MPLALQAKMLRLLQEQAFERVGGNETVRTDVRLIAATHRDLKAWSAEGKFRPDLYYRLGVFTIHLPPLRERGDDLPLLVQHYLRRFSRELGREVREVAPEALERLRRYSWPGNIRELQSVLKQALLQASGTDSAPGLPARLPGRASQNRDGRSGRGGRFGLEAFIRPLSRLSIQATFTRRPTARSTAFLLTRVLEDTGGNQHQAARLLGIARETLRRKLRELGLHVTRPARVRRRLSVLNEIPPTYPRALRASGRTDTAVGRFFANRLENCQVDDGNAPGLPASGPPCSPGMSLASPPTSKHPGNTRLAASRRSRAAAHRSPLISSARRLLQPLRKWVVLVKVPTGTGEVKLAEPVLRIEP